MKVLAFLILLVGAINICAADTAALSCFDCTYWEGHDNSNEDCLASNPGYKYAINCKVPENQTLTAYCRKLQIKDTEDLTITAVHRSCAYTDTARDLADQCWKLREDLDLRPMGFGVFEKGTLDCYCLKDKCNGANNLGLNAFVLVLGLALIKLLNIF